MRKHVRFLVLFFFASLASNVYAQTPTINSFTPTFIAQDLMLGGSDSGLSYYDSASGAIHDLKKNKYDYI